MVCRALVVKWRGHFVWIAMMWEQQQQQTSRTPGETPHWVWALRRWLLHQEDGAGSAEVPQGLLEAPAAGDVVTLLLSLSWCSHASLLGRVWWWAPARPCPAQLGGHLQPSFSPLPEGVSLHSARSLDTQKLNHCCTSCWWQQALGGFQGDKLYVQHWCWTLASVSRHAAARLPPHASTTSLWWPSRPAFGNTKHCRSKGPNAFLMVVFSINSPCAVELNQTLISLWHI